MTRPKTRSSGIDAVRLLSAFFIVMVHTVGLAVVSDTAGAYGTALVQLFSSFTSFPINCFAMLSGYLLCTARFSARRVLRLWCEVLFYAVTVPLALAALGLEGLTLRSLFTMLCPVLSWRWWYISVYFFILFIFPFYNRLISGLDQRSFLALLGVLAAFFCLWPTLLPFGTSPDPAGGSGIVWVSVMYFAGAYIRKYPPACKRAGVWAALFFGATLLLFAWQAGLTVLSGIVGHGAAYVGIMNRVVSLPVAAQSVCLVLWGSCVQIKSPRLEGLLTALAPHALGVYLVHTHPSVYIILFSALRASGFLNAGAPLFGLKTIGVCVGIFAACIVIDWLRALGMKGFENSALFAAVCRKADALPFAKALRDAGETAKAE